MEYHCELLDLPKKEREEALKKLDQEIEEMMPNYLEDTKRRSKIVRGEKIKTIIHLFQLFSLPDTDLIPFVMERVNLDEESADFLIEWYKNGNSLYL